MLKASPLKKDMRQAASRFSLSLQLARFSSFEAFGYLAASVFALGVDFVFFTAALAGGFNYLLAASLGYFAGAFVAFGLSIRYVFTQRRLRNVALEFLVFCVLGLAGLTVTLLVMYIAVNYFSVSPMISKAVATGASFLANFCARKLVLFTS